MPEQRARRLCICPHHVSGLPRDMSHTEFYRHIEGYDERNKNILKTYSHNLKATGPFPQMPRNPARIQSTNRAPETSDDAANVRESQRARVEEIEDEDMSPPPPPPRDPDDIIMRDADEEEEPEINKPEGDDPLQDYQDFDTHLPDPIPTQILKNSPLALV
ncbi:hypothetical protein CONPUDRAFT_69526 [Coniophora puteana RWD-64-598 SS2]|uniref:Uncharacterized protein n=1 Tax=Coniophora puteana (strain RWD-64-598) TaxID=741705 RepID=A0A5M3N832_CONPW|nr:uncharacterized protein CONPUDRAFT_69526 [Coniophora puteana RWD-64-598 SS2]EIW87264.1 hypothetical protein CONPUDRAFT_69526 [Coniophora puteana RWD-64-598 SS2]